MKRMYFTPAWMFGSTWRMLPTFNSFPVAGMTCMTPIAPTGLFARLVQPRFLVALRGHQQVIELVLVAVLLEDCGYCFELPSLGVSRGVFHILDVIEIAAFDRVAKGVAFGVLANEVVDDLADLGILFANRDGQPAAAVYGDISCAP